MEQEQIIEQPRYFIKEWRRRKGITRSQLSAVSDATYRALHIYETYGTSAQGLPQMSFTEVDREDVDQAILAVNDNIEFIADYLHMDPVDLTVPPPNGETIPATIEMSEHESDNASSQSIITTISTEEPGQQLIPGQVLSFDGPHGHVEYEEGDSVQVGEEHWRRVTVAVRFPCLKEEAQSALTEARRMAKDTLAVEVEKMFAQEAERFNRKLNNRA